MSPLQPETLVKGLGELAKAGSGTELSGTTLGLGSRHHPLLNSMRQGEAKSSQL